MTDDKVQCSHMIEGPKVGPTRLMAQAVQANGQGQRQAFCAVCAARANEGEVSMNEAALQAAATAISDFSFIAVNVECEHTDEAWDCSQCIARVALEAALPVLAQELVKQIREFFKTHQIPEVTT